jgi:hypothetical protein
MSYGSSPKSWTVQSVNSNGNPHFNLRVGDILVFTGDGTPGSPGVTKRYREIPWGSGSVYDDAAGPVVVGRHEATSNKTGTDYKFEIAISSPTPVGSLKTHLGSIDLKDGGVGSGGTWEAQEGGTP